MNFIDKALARIIEMSADDLETSG
jgi:hypothetical protein